MQMHSVAPLLPVENAEHQYGTSLKVESVDLQHTIHWSAVLDPVHSIVVHMQVSVKRLGPLVYSYTCA